MSISSELSLHTVESNNYTNWESDRHSNEFPFFIPFNPALELCFVYTVVYPFDFSVFFSFFPFNNAVDVPFVPFDPAVDLAFVYAFLYPLKLSVFFPFVSFDPAVDLTFIPFDPAVDLAFVYAFVYPLELSVFFSFIPFDPAYALTFTTVFSINNAISNAITEHTLWINTDCDDINIRAAFIANHHAISPASVDLAPIKVSNLIRCDLANLAAICIAEYTHSHSESHNFRTKFGVTNDSFTNDGFINFVNVSFAVDRPFDVGFAIDDYCSNDCFADEYDANQLRPIDAGDRAIIVFALSFSESGYINTELHVHACSTFADPNTIALPNHHPYGSTIWGHTFSHIVCQFYDVSNTAIVQSPSIEKRVNENTYTQPDRQRRHGTPVRPTVDWVGADQIFDNPLRAPRTPKQRSYSAIFDSHGPTPLRLAVRATNAANVTFQQDKLRILCNIYLLSDETGSFARRRLDDTLYVYSTWTMVNGTITQNRTLEDVATTELSVLEPLTVVDVSVSSIPINGRLEVEPAKGIAFFDKFRLWTLDWESDNLPLQYEFKSEVAGAVDTEAILQATSNASTLSGTRLREGSPNVTLKVVAIDAIGAKATAVTRAHVVAESNQSTAFEEILDEAIDEAFAEGSFDSLSQIATSATTYAVSDPVALDSLVTAYVDGYQALADTASEAVLDQAAATLLYLVDDPVALPVDSAKNALDMIEDVAGNLDGIGISDDSSAPKTIVQTLSKLLDSELFADGGNSTTQATDTMLNTIDSVNQAQRESLVVNEQTVGTNSTYISTASSRFRPSRDRQVEITTDQMNSAAIVEAIQGALYATSLTEFVGLNNTPMGSAASSDVVRLYFSATGNDATRRRRVQSANTSRTAVTLQIAGGDGAVANATNITVECPCHFEGYKIATCPDNVTTRSVYCDGTPQSVVFSCNSSRSACATWENERWVVPDNCKIAESEGGVSSCECDIDDSRGAGVYSTTDEAVDTLERYTNVFHTRPSLKASLLMLVTAIVLFVTVVLLAGLGESLDKRHAANFVRQEGSTAIIPFSEQEQKQVWTQTLVNRHPFLNLLFIYSQTVPRRLRAWKFGVELFIILMSTALEIVWGYPDEDCGRHSSEDACANPKSLGSRQHLCKWDVCSGSCADNEQGNGAATAADHIIMVFMIELFIAPILAFADWIMDEYLLAPVPPELQWYHGGGPSRTQSTAVEFSNKEELKMEEEQESNKNEDESMYATSLKAWINLIRHSSSSSASFGGDKLSSQTESRFGIRKARRASVSRSANLGVLSRASLSAITVAMQKSVQMLIRGPSSSSSRTGVVASPLEDGDVSEEREHDGTPDDSRLIDELAFQIRHAVLRRQQELHDVMVAAHERRDEVGRLSLHILEVMEEQLLSEWGWVPGPTLWELEIAKVIRNHLEAASELYEELKHLGNDPTTFETRMEKVLERERFDRLSAIERKVYAKTQDRALYQIDRREEPPPVRAYVLAWAVFALFAGGVLVFMAQVATTIGTGEFKLMLMGFSVTVVMFYVVVLPFEVFFFDLLLPGLLTEHMKKLRDPGRLRRFPYRTKLPDSTCCYLCMLFPWLAESRLGALLLGDLDNLRREVSSSSLSSGGSSEIKNYDSLLVQLSKIYRDSAFQPSPGTRLALTLSALILIVPSDYQELIFEELVLGITTLSAVFTQFTELPQAFNLASRKPTDANEVINYVAAVVFALVFGGLITLVVKVLNSNAGKKLLGGSYERVASILDEDDDDDDQSAHDFLRATFEKKPEPGNTGIVISFDDAARQQDSGYHDASSTLEPTSDLEARTRSS
ncbi:hypothetical protein CTAYLR_003309 [Chrysophaeum taylorii]|uniref:PKD/REJ-like domain-containing protein n=1 Tax=Chrysophaeum taylorii TaxID=2483200 RepID=A0AAD7XQP1_9STRA|nr:hypothetical protein CTAYLR_003309 [Chrysophaeum taylorii]